ncbi:deoxyribodipyrimidine photo-lyase/cryptochrome family protein [Vibrio chagasii]|nr:deoxyribodipyrimidine photo-lyase/cryptochrome family protein [Vibrio chagasii]
MQKFESECAMEYRFVSIRLRSALAKRDGKIDTSSGMEDGDDDVPLVDACMRCHHHTGYINFPHALNAGELSHSPYEHGLA